MRARVPKIAADWTAIHGKLRIGTTVQIMTHDKSHELQIEKRNQKIPVNHIGTDLFKIIPSAR